MKPYRQRAIWDKPAGILMILLFLVIAAYGISEWIPWGSPHAGWKKSLFRADTSRISTIAISSALAGQEELVFNRLPDQSWQLSFGNHLYPAMPTRISQMLAVLAQTDASDRWLWNDPRFASTGLNSDQGIQVTWYEDQQQMAVFYVGNVAEKCTNDQPCTFLRIGSEKHSYQVTGDLRRIFGNHWKSYIQSPLFRLDLASLQAAIFRFPCDSVVTIQKIDHTWSHSAMRGWDNHQIALLLQPLDSLTPYDPSPVEASWLDNQQHLLFTDRLELFFEDMEEPVIITRVLTPSQRESPYIFQNSVYPGLYFQLSNTHARQLFQWTGKHIAKQTAVQ